MDKEMKDANGDIGTIGKMIKGIRIAMMTTVDSDGVLRSRPMATQEQEYDGVLWFVTKAESMKVRSIENDQHVNIAYADPDSHRYVSISGRARLTADRAKIKDLWTPLLKAWFPEGPEDQSIMLIKVDVASCDYWDSPGGFIVEVAGFAKSVITGKPLDMHTNHKHIDVTTH